MFKRIMQCDHYRMLLMALVVGVVTGGRAWAADPVDFSRQIRPILSDKCFACHGPDEQTREAGLRLDIRDDAVDAIAPGNPAESELVQRILSDDPDLQMPPKKSHKDLEADEMELLKQWVAEGAKYEQHWSFRPLKRARLPAIKHFQNKNAIDALLLNKLASESMDFAPPADKVTLVRRLYIDLLGLPPTPAEVDAFVNDSSPDAWDNLVARLLDDTRFGERMAVYWLDLVRYADTIGYHSDAYVEVSAYRDYVIDSFNQNKPFDQFSIEQLAGDLLPEATPDQKIASGYNRLLQTTEEGGAQAKEYIAIYAADRVRNVSGVWMGLTVGCAQCHDHKYDPITAKDFYSLAAFFADIKEKAVGKRDPNFKVISPEQQAHLDELRHTADRLRLPQLLSDDPDLAAKLQAGQSDWESKTLAALDDKSSPWMTAPTGQYTATGGVVLKRQDDGSYLSTKGNPNKGDYICKIETTGPVRAIRLEIFPDQSFSRKEGFSRGNGNIVLTDFSVRINDEPVEITSAIADYEQASWPIANTLDDDDRSGWAVDGHHKSATSHQAVFALAPEATKKETADAPAASQVVEIRMRHQSVHPKHLIGRFRLSLSQDPNAGLSDSIRIPETIAKILRKSPDQRNESERKQLREHYQSIATELNEPRRQLARIEKELETFEKSLPTTLITEAMPDPRMTRILPRGNWLDDSGEVVQPAVPDFLPHTAITDRRANRLDLAQWLFEPENPLTARTFVNRLWKLFYGRGLSRNLDDLGGQGQPPTHPELLDWLALEFQESGWDIKQMIRLIVTSGSYMQSSQTTPHLRLKDPNNDYFARQGRWRIEAEFIRDTALQLSGLLRDGKTGGKSVKPYQPVGYWEHLNFPKRTWSASKGEDLYRRTLYTFWCRTFLHPSLLAFDAPSREECTAQRARSNIPQQALALLNDPVYVETAREFATRIILSAPERDHRLQWAFREATSRAATEDELQVLRNLHDQQTELYSDATDAANAVVRVGDAPLSDTIDTVELAIWTQVARALLNLYETTSRF
ncbi:MAG: DUF1553 domain-containing protein [Pirellulaceae bacterium]|nr:DUF1553 domain-containing protein [Pirellulaceae bacterium]